MIACVTCGQRAWYENQCYNHTPKNERDAIHEIKRLEQIALVIYQSTPNDPNYPSSIPTRMELIGATEDTTTFAKWVGNNKRGIVSYIGKERFTQPIPEYPDTMFKYGTGKRGA